MGRHPLPHLFRAKAPETKAEESKGLKRTPGGVRPPPYITCLRQRHWTKHNQHKQHVTLACRELTEGVSPSDRSVLLRVAGGGVRLECEHGRLTWRWIWKPLEKWLSPVPHECDIFRDCFFGRFWSSKAICSTPRCRIRHEDGCE